MKQGALFSLVLHLAILALVLIGLPTRSNPFEVGNSVAVPIVFENAAIAETTNQVEGTPEPVEEAKVEPPTPPEKPAPQVEQQAALEPPPEPLPEPVPQPPEPVVEAVPPPPAPEPTPPTPEPPAPAVAEPAPPEPTPPEPQVAEPLPTPPEPAPPEQVAVAAPQPEPKPEPVPVPTPEAKVDEAAKEPDAAAPPEKPRKKVTLPEPPKQEVVKKQENKLDSILKDVTKRKEEPQQESKPQEQQQAASTQPAKKSSASTSGGQVTQSMKDAIARQVGQCWNVDIGTKDLEAVEVRVFMNQDGTVQGAEIVDTGRYNSDGTFRATADRALRAVKNPRCQPFPLPANAYAEWSTIVFNFDPAQMF